MDDLPRRALPQGSPRRSPKAMRPGAPVEADENASPRPLVAAGTASPQRKKVLGERNGAGGAGAAATTPAQKPAQSPPSLTGRGAGVYDPKTNYTTPRPEFLRYDPGRHREILLRLERAADVEDDDDSSSATSGTTASEAAASLVESARESGSEASLDDISDDEEDEEEVVSERRGGWRRLLRLLLVAVACWLCYMYCMNPPPVPLHSQDAFEFDGSIGSMYEGGVHEFDSLRLLGPVDLIGSGDFLGDANQFLQLDSENMADLYGQRVSPGNSMAIAMMGIADTCPNVPLPESTCQVGDESSEIVAPFKEDSVVDEQEPEVVTESFHNDDGQSSSIGCLGGNISCDSIGFTSIHLSPIGSGLVQEDGEDYSNRSVPQLVSMEKAMESASDNLDDRMDLGTEGLDHNTELWQYENTAGAARAIYTMVKFLWSTMEPHLLQILACLSVAGFVASMFRYFQTSGKIPVPSSQPMPSKSLAQVPVLAPHKIAKIPVSPQTVELPVYSSEQPGDPTVPKQDLSDGFHVPMQLPLSKSDPFVSVKLPVVDHGKLQQVDAENMKALRGKFQDHRDVDISKSPVVKVLGEFSFADSSRGNSRSIKSSNQHARDVAVQESSESLGNNVDKAQKNSSFIQSPIVQRTRAVEKAVNGEKDATPTPLRRSSRFRNTKVTSP